MSQSDVFDWLKHKRECGNDSYFLPKDIEKGLRDQGLSNGALDGIRGDCFRLWMQGNGCLEMYNRDTKGITNWLKAFRLKKQYCGVCRHESK